jgi:hypothetical protein
MAVQNLQSTVMKVYEVQYGAQRNWDIMILKGPFKQVYVQGNEYVCTDTSKNVQFQVTQIQPSF